MGRFLEHLECWLLTLVNRLIGWHYKWQSRLGPRMLKSSASPVRKSKGKGRNDLGWPANKTQWAAKGRGGNQWGSPRLVCSIDFFASRWNVFFYLLPISFERARIALLHLFEAFEKRRRQLWAHSNVFSSPC